MFKAIVTTTIHSPTQAIKKFIEIAHKQDWLFYIVGDLKTPHDEYRKLEDERVTYLDPDDQNKYLELSEAIGWNCIQRRNIGFIEAYKAGAEVIATVDDDNIPYETWGKNLSVGKTINAVTYSTKCGVFNVLSLWDNTQHLCHRGYPLEFKGTTSKYRSVKSVTPLVQADLWDGNPDIDAIARITHDPKDIVMEAKDYIHSLDVSVFNSQNTFLSRELFPDYFLFPGIGRMDDIWASYLINKKYPGRVVYAPASVYQDRNNHNLIDDLEDELLGYRHNLEIAINPDSIFKYLPDKAQKSYELYKKEFI